MSTLTVEDAKWRTLVRIPSGKTGRLICVKHGKARVQLQSGAIVTCAVEEVTRA